MVLVKSACRYDGTNRGPFVTRLETGIGRSGRWSGAEKEPGQTEYRQETGVCISNSLNIVKCFEDLQKGEHFFHKRHFGERFGCKVSLLSDSPFSVVRGGRMLRIRLSGHRVRTVYPRTGCLYEGLQDRMVLKKRIGSLFCSDIGRFIMSGIYPCIVGKREQLLADASYEQFPVASGQVGPADAALYQGIAGEKAICAGTVEYKASRRMARNTDDGKGFLSEAQAVAVPELPGREDERHTCFQADLAAPPAGHRHPIAVQRRSAEGASAGFCQEMCSEHVVDVQVGSDDQLDFPSVQVDETVYARTFTPEIASRVDDHCTAACLVSQEITVGVIGIECFCMNQHGLFLFPRKITPYYYNRD